MEKIKQLTEANYEEVLALNQYAFQYTLTEEEKARYKKKMTNHTILGWMELDELAAKVHIIPFQVYIHRELMEMGGIAAVASWPEQRRGGKVKQLLQEALQIMKREGKTLSYLHPFSVPFYRKYGWELAFDNLASYIPIKHFRKDWGSTGTVSRLTKSSETIALLQGVYTAYAKTFSGTLNRTEHWWDIILNEKDQIAVANLQSPEAYVIYEMKGNVFHVKDAAFSTLNGRKQLLAFIGNHDSMAEHVQWQMAVNDPLPLLTEEPRFEQKRSPYFMARIVDVEGFLRQYPFAETSYEAELTIAVQDDFLPENTGQYRLSINQRQITVTTVTSAKTADIVMDVQQLVQILLGYKRPQELSAADLIKGEAPSIELLEAITPRAQTFLPDFF